MDRFILATILLLLNLGLYASLAVAAPASLPDCSIGPQNVGPGPYVLNGDQQAANNSDCWVLTGDNVTIDFQGFTVKGGSNPGAAFNDYRVTHSNIVIRNGTITGFQYGIIFGATHEVQIDGMRIVGNRNGLGLSSRSYVSNSLINSNSGAGIALIGSDSSVTNSSISYNGSYGLLGGNNLIVSGNAVNGNGGRGIRAASHSLITGNTATIMVGPGSILPALLRLSGTPSTTIDSSVSILLRTALLRSLATPLTAIPLVYQPV
jgi:hypothetical protein